MLRGFPGGTSGKELACQCRRHTRHGFDPWIERIPWRKAWQPTPVFFPGLSRGQRGLAGYSRSVAKSWLSTPTCRILVLLWWITLRTTGPPGEEGIGHGSLHILFGTLACKFSQSPPLQWTQPVSRYGSCTTVIRSWVLSSTFIISNHGKKIKKNPTFYSTEQWSCDTSPVNPTWFWSPAWTLTVSMTLGHECPWASIFLILFYNRVVTTNSELLLSGFNEIKYVRTRNTCLSHSCIP